MRTIWHDVRFGLRQLRKNPGFTIVAVVTIALGIGAGTAVFSLVNAVLLRSLPVPNPHELRVLQWTGANPRPRSIEGNYRQAGNRATADSVSCPMFMNLREKGGDYADIFGFSPVKEAVVRSKRKAAITANGMIVSDNFFSGLGVRPFMGRLFAPGDGNSNAVRSVVITYPLWKRYLADDSNVLGFPVTINNVDLTIMGVLPREFPGIRPNDPREFYVLLSPQSQFRGNEFASTFHWWVRMMARLKPKADEKQLKAALDVIFPHEAKQQMDNPEILVRPGRGGLAFDREVYQKPLLLMLAIVGLVMLVVCANLAGLSLARSAARQHELAVRAALGAMRARLMRLALTENFLLALMGGGLGVLLAMWGKTSLSRLLVGTTEGLHCEQHLDLIVLGFSLGATFLTALLSGLLPAIRAGRADPLSGLKERGSVGTRRLRTGRFLVAAQICISLLLLFGAGLYVRTFINLSRINAGFNTERLLLFELNPRGAGYKPDQCIAYHNQVLDALASTPGVLDACLANYHLFDNQTSHGEFTLSGQSERSQPAMETHRLRVNQTFFSTMGIPILRGRALSATDTYAAVVNEAFVRKHSPNQNPIGQTMHLWDADWEIVGICSDVKYYNIKGDIPPTTYFSYRGRVPYYCPSFTVRTKLHPLALASAVRKAVAQIDPDIPVAHIRTQKQLRDNNISQERFMVTLCSALAGLALLLVCIGLYGLMAYHVAGRTNEIAIRMAVGARPGDVAQPILREALTLAIFGIGAGLPLVFVISRFIKSLLYDVTSHDPVTLGIVILTLMVVALLAAWIPARRASKIDPMEALRYE